MRRENWFQIKMLVLQRLKGISAWHYNATKQRRGLINSDFTLEQLSNGLVRTSSLYYAIGRDTETGQWVIYCSRGQKHLKTSENKKGIKTFDNDEYRYHVATLDDNDTIKDDIRKAIRDHHKDFKNYSFERARIHGGRFTKVISIKRLLKKYFKSHIFDEVFGWTNKDYSLSVHQYGKKDWRLKFSTPYSHLLNLPRFTEIESIRLTNKFLKSVLTSRRTVGSFESQHLSMAYLDLMNSQRSQRTWRGQNATPLSEGPLTNGSTAIYSFAIDEVKSEEAATETQFELGAAIAAVLMTSAKLLGTLTGARLIMLALLSGFGSRKGVGVFAKAKKWAQWHMPGAKGIVSVVPTHGYHRANFKDNVNRLINAKPDLERKDKIYIFDGNEYSLSDVTYDNTEQIDAAEKYWKERWITAYDSKGFSGRDTEIQSNITTDISYNGLVRLSYRCPETKTIITYTKYVEELNINPHIAIPDDVKKLLEKDEIVKFVHNKPQNSFISEAITSEDIINEIKPALYKNMRNITQQDHRLAKGHIKWLFRDVAKDYRHNDELELKEEDIDNCIHSMRWTGRNPNIEFLKRNYGDDWQEMQCIAKEKLKGLMVFNKNAVYPNVGPILKEAQRNSNKGWFRQFKKEKSLEKALSA